MNGIGHNGGPTLEPGSTWRTHCWRAARAALLPKLPLEVVRLHVRRAAEIGLDYKTYAGVRATTGHDLVAFLFSTNALRLLRETDRMAAADVTKLAGVRQIGRLVAEQLLRRHHHGVRWRSGNRKPPFVILANTDRIGERQRAGRA